MVPQRILQAVRNVASRNVASRNVASTRARLRPHQLLWRPHQLLWIVLLLAGVGVADAQELSDDQAFPQIHALVVDLRPGEATLRAPSQDAFVDALSSHGELLLTDDAELASLLGRRPYSAVLERGRARLSAAILAFGGLDCASASLRAQQAILDLAAASAGGANAKTELHQAYLYRFLCADRLGKVDQAMASATMLRALIDTDRPKEISVDTWDKYPLLDAQSNRRRVAVEIKSEPSGAAISIDYEKVGTTPSTHLLSEGQHIVALGYEDRGVSQEITVTGKGSMSLPLHKSQSKWKGISASITKIQEASSQDRPQAMGHLLAATLAEVAFVMREPGRVAVWILPSGRRGAELVGHAPNAQIAGELALQGLVESRTAPGLDPNRPLLLETTTTTRATKKNRWWIYGIVLGAAVVGAGFIITQDLSEDRQRIEVSLP